MRRLALVAGLVAALALWPGVATADGQAPMTGAEEDLGHSIPARVLSQEQSQGVDAEGRPQAYWVTAGNTETPAMFQVTDIRSRQVVFRERLPAGINSWASTFSAADGTVYFGMTEGQLYRWKPGDAKVTSLGVPYQGEGIWRLAAAPDGTVYGGTYPGGLLISYDPSSGRFTNHGQLVPGETYGRSLAVDEKSVYFGTQPRARMARFDRATGQAEQIALPAEYATHEVVYDMTLAGKYLLLRVQPSNDLLVYDRESGTYADIVKAISGRQISTLDPTGRYVYFRISSEGVVRYDLTTLTWTKTGWGPNAFPGSWAWIDMADPDFPGKSLAMTYYYGRIYVWNPETRKSAYVGEADLEGTPNPLQSLGRAPDGAIHVGAFLSPPGMARFDPATGSTGLLASAGQVEGFGTYGRHLVYGRYPDGQLLDYDIDRPWAYGTNPGPAVTIGREQDRPQAFAAVGDLMAVGSVPKSGRLGGALTLWNPATGAIDVRRDIVPAQSVVSLAAADGLIYGGTSINGGYGIEPTATEARLFVFDPATGKVVRTITPVPGATSVNALTVDARGRIWGLADGTVFAYDARPGKVVKSRKIFPVQKTMYGQERGLVLRDGRTAYASIAGALWRIDVPSMKAVKVVGGGVSHLIEGGDGNLYYTRSTKLYRWKF
ncbi:hypothetical protein [Spongiactinospora sp. TRM90649]|uniref:hypothetical protein n=1 Tax=Spongiactinospora sp. TRM90649 TaxID=3031114 RepID=UPI0023F9DE95|nr:hypothetical protein [Spongiactinospora sp. TRM90649]MDF5753715.1 hypothetical protein [Spongiactinospora sp. TRM90649]